LRNLARAVIFDVRKANKLNNLWQTFPCDKTGLILPEQGLVCTGTGNAAQILAEEHFGAHKRCFVRTNR